MIENYRAKTHCQKETMLSPEFIFLVDFCIFRTEFGGPGVVSGLKERTPSYWQGRPEICPRLEERTPSYWRELGRPTPTAF